MQKFAYKLLEDGMIDFIGSDTHRVQHIEKLKTINLEKKHLHLVKEVITKTREQF